jgi:hypothetical protein
MDLCGAQADRTPALATAAKGQQLLDRIGQRVADFLQAMIDGQRVVPIPPFYE